MMIACAHSEAKKFGSDRKGNQRMRCLQCGKTWTIREVNPLGEMRLPVDDAKMVLRMLVEGSSIRAPNALRASTATRFANCW